MRIFTFWTPLLVAGGILSLAAIGAGIPAKTLDGDWSSSITATCSRNRDKCLSVSIRDQALGIWDGKVVLVNAQRGREDAAVALIEAQITGNQKYFVTVAADTGNKGERK